MSWLDGPILVHVGLHKTATTWLQELYFPSEGSGFWIPEVKTSHRDPVKEIGHRLLRNADGHLIDESNFDAEALRAALSGLVPPRGMVPVISNERLAGHPLSGGFDRLMLAKRIKRVFPNARVMVTIRSQHTLVPSNYFQYLRYGGWHTPEDYLRPARDIRLPSLSLAFWDYDRMEKTYAALFGSENVLLLPHELLRREPRTFVDSLSRFAGLSSQVKVENQEINLRKPPVSAYLLRRLTCLNRKSAANAFIPPLVSRGVDRVIEKAAKRLLDAVTPRALEARLVEGLERRIANVVGDYYDASNKQFAARQAFNLAALGYGPRGPESGHR